MGKQKSVNFVSLCDLPLTSRGFQKIPSFRFAELGDISTKYRYRCQTRMHVVRQPKFERIERSNDGSIEIGRAVTSAYTRKAGTYVDIDGINGTSI